MRTVQQVLATDYSLEEGVDYSYIGGVLTALPKIRIINVTPENPEGEEEEYFASLPDLEVVKYKSLTNIVLCLTEYLLDKEELRDYANDSFGVDEGNLYSWDFTNIPKPTADQLLALEPMAMFKLERHIRVNGIVNEGKNITFACDKAVNYIVGLDESELTELEQEARVEIFEDILTALVVNKKPGIAKNLVEAIVPDTTLVTEEMQNDLLFILDGFQARS